MEEEGIFFDCRGERLKYVFRSPAIEGGSDYGLGEVEVAGLVIAGRFFPLGRKTADPQRCQRCGRCCSTLGKSIQASPSDIKRWIEGQREDLLGLLNTFREGGTLTTDGTLYLGEGDRCRFLGRDGDSYSCSIHGTRPEVCREYPLNVGGVCKNGVDFREL